MEGHEVFSEATGERASLVLKSFVSVLIRGKFAHESQPHIEIPVNCRSVGVDPHGLREMTNGFLKPPLPGQSYPKVVVGTRMVGLYSESFTIVNHGLIESSLLARRIPRL